MNRSLPCSHDHHGRCGGLLIAGPDHLAWGCTIGCDCLCHLGLRPREIVTDALIIYLPAPPPRQEIVVVAAAP